MRILFVGAGAWGTALAANASAHGQQVSLWLRDAAQAKALRDQGENTRYLPGIALPAGLRILGPDDAPLGELAAAADLTIIATPMRALRESLLALGAGCPALAWLCKGFEQGGCLGHEVCAQAAPPVRCAVLSGPSFALEVARQQPTALVAASQDAPLRQALVAAFHNPSLRVYASDDVVGVEVGGAVKNLLAIAAGLCDGLGLGMNARAALLTRGLAEMTRLGLALGAHAETFMGLSGMGDLLLTATGELSRNRQVGLALAGGQSLAQILASLGHVAEGVYSARTVCSRAQALGVDMPIAQAVARLLDGPPGPDAVRQAAQQLMARQPREELPAAAL